MTRYVFQAGHGQLKLLNNRRSISKVIDDETTLPSVKTSLQEVQAIIDFGKLYGLDFKENYKNYVAIEGDAVVWVVSAAKPYYFTSKTWTFPFVGNFNYLGWFSKESALEYAESLKKEGWEVYTRGATAYSTLGWFDDPILSSMIPDNPKKLGLLVNVLLHEAVHTTVYIKGQSYFNESLANFVADYLTPNYLKQKSNGKESIDWYKENKVYNLAYGKRFHEAFVALDYVYKELRSEEWMREQKGRILDQLQKDLKLSNKPNNAYLIQFKTYHQDTGSFNKFFKECGEDISLFLKSLKQIKENDFDHQQEKDFSKIFEKIKCMRNPVSSV